MAQVESTLAKPVMPRMPGRSNRTVLIGRTGTGKTVAGLWHLSNQDLSYPWIVINFKNDEHIDSIENTQEIDYTFNLDRRSKGLYILRPLPSDIKAPARGELSPMEKFLWKIWHHENCGIFCDELFMMGISDAGDACLTQGRSKRIPMILCTQRPAWVTRFAFSEASFIQVFDLNDADDINRVERFVPLTWEEEKPLAPHQSWYFEIDRNLLFRFNPTPNMDEVRKKFAAKLPKRWKIL